MQLDFSGLRELAYRGCSNEHEREQRDRAIEQGFTVVEAAETPFNGRHDWDVEKPAPAPEKPSTRRTEPLTSIDGKRDYNPIYRATHEFHKRHTPPRLDEGYWQEVADDMQAIAKRFNSDPFVMSLLISVFDELERECKAMQEGATGQ